MIIPLSSETNDNIVDYLDGTSITGQPMPNSDNIAAVNSIELQSRRIDAEIPEANITVAIVQNVHLLKIARISITFLRDILGS